MSSTTPVSSWYQLHYSWASASACWKRKTNPKRVQKSLWITPPDTSTAKHQLNPSLKASPLQQQCTSQAYEKKEKQKTQERHRQFCGLHKAPQGPALPADRKTRVCFPRPSSSFCPALASCGALSDSLCEGSRPQAEPRTQCQPQSHKTKRTMLA